MLERPKIRSAEEQRAWNRTRELDTCVHYNGTINPRCKAGVVYDQFRTPVSGVALFKQLPCWKSNGCESCDKAEFPTLETVIAEEDERRIRISRRFAAHQAIVENIGNSKTAASGSISCPCCEIGTLRFSRASNGHIHASCSTSGCVSWME